MKRKRRSAEQVVAKLREADAMLTAGASMAQLCQRLEISKATFHRWRNQYGGMKAEEARRLKELEQENARLKKLASDLSRISRSVKDALQLVGTLTKRGVSLSVLSPSLTFTPDAMRKFHLTLFAALAELESTWKGERVRNGQNLARSRGVRIGRLPNLPLRAKIAAMSKTYTVQEIADKQKCSRQDVYHLLQANHSERQRANANRRQC